MKQNRGRIEPTVRPAPNAEPIFLPEPPSKLIFGTHIPCHACRTTGKKGKKKCGICNGTGIETLN